MTDSGSNEQGNGMDGLRKTWGKDFFFNQVIYITVKRRKFY